MRNEFVKRLVSSIILIPFSLFFIIKGSFFLYFFIFICLFIALYEWHIMTKNKPYYLIGLIFISFSFYTFYKIRVFDENNFLYILFILTICISTDLGGYFFGKLFKGPKLSKLSPNKTYSGMLGGYVLSIIFSFFFLNFFKINIEQYNLFLFIVLISTISQLGDITFSLFKRLSKIKDTGKIIPGHGGILDRIDGMIFVFPATYILLVL